MAKKIVFIGSGSLVFTRNLVRDLLTFDAFRDAEIALVDINETNLALSKKAVDGIVTRGNYPAKVTATTDRREVLKDAVGVVTTIAVGTNRDFYNEVYYGAASLTVYANMGRRAGAAAAEYAK